MTCNPAAYELLLSDYGGGLEARTAEAAAQGTGGEEAEERKCHPGYGVEYPVAVVAEIVNHHVASHLLPGETVMPDFHEAYRLIGKDMKHQDVERVVAYEHEQVAQSVAPAVEQLGGVVHHQESYGAGEWQRPYVAQGAAVVHAAEMQMAGSAYEQKIEEE